VRGAFEGSRRSLIARWFTQQSLDAGQSWQRFEQSTADSVHIRMSFRVVCDVTYFGVGCARICAPRDDHFGHYSCDVAGNRVCNRGWNGTYCDSGIKHCYLKSLILSLKPHSNRPLYSNTVIGTLAADGWAVTIIYWHSEEGTGRAGATYKMRRCLSIWCCAINHAIIL